MVECYPSGWAKLVLAVDLETGEFHAIGGDHKPGEGDTLYPALEVLKDRLKRRPSAYAAHKEIAPAVQELARSCGVLVDGKTTVAVSEEGTVYFNPEEMRRDAEEYEYTMKLLDSDKVPRHDETGAVYSLYGRICWKAKKAVENEKTFRR